MKSLKVSKKTLFALLIVVSFLGAMIPSMAIVEGLELQEHISLTTFTYTAVDSTASSTDYMLVGNYIYTPMGESVWSKDGETSAGNYLDASNNQKTGTSYVSLEDSCIIGEYASEPLSWSDYAYISSSFSATEAEGGDTACGSGNITDASHSGGSTSSYISCSADFGNAASDGNLLIEG